MDHLASPEQYGSRPNHTVFEQAANRVNTLHKPEAQGHERCVVLLDVAIAFPSTLHDAIIAVLFHAGFPKNCIKAVQRLHMHADTCCDEKATAYTINQHEE